MDFVLFFTIKTSQNKVLKILLYIAEAVRDFDYTIDIWQEESGKSVEN